MKKTTLFLLFMLFAMCANVSAQRSKPRGGYLNFSYHDSKLEYIDLGTSFKSDYGAAFTVGRTFYLHKTPILNLIRIGLDWSYFDLNFASFSTTYNGEYGETEKKYLYQGEAGMHFGPSVTITPAKGLNISGYFRYAPSFSAIYDDDAEEFSGGFGSFFVAGASVSYKVISMGVEQRWGDAKHEFEINTDYGEDYEVKIKTKLKMSGPRFYIGLRF